MSDTKDQPAKNAGESNILHMTPAMNSGRGSVNFYIEKFPKEFKKGLFQNVDKLFTIILLLSLIINVSAILFLEKLTSSVSDEKTISRIQQQYAQLLLNSDFATVSPITSGTATSAYKRDAEVVSGLSAYVNNFNIDVSKYLNAFQPKDVPFAETRAASGSRLSREKMADMRQSSAERRFATRSELSRSVENVGLLGLISSSGRAVDQEYVQDLLEYANKNSTQLQTVLSKLDRIKKPHYGNGIYQQKLALRTKGADYRDALKGGRKSADAEVNVLMQNMSHLQKAKNEVVARNTHYENIPSSSMASAGGERKTLLRRDAKSVVATIRSHLRSLQDCYKRELRETPSLRGKVLVRFTVNPRGAVVAAELVSSTFNNSRLENCLLAKIRRWRDFPPCDSSLGNQTFRQTFKFGM